MGASPVLALAPDQGLAVDVLLQEGEALGSDALSVEVLDDR